MDDREKERKLELANKKLEVELGDIHLQLLRDVGKIISLKWHRDLYDKAKTKFKTIKEKDISEEVRKKAAEIFKTFVLINKVYVNKIVDGKFPCANEDLNFLQKIADEFPTFLNWSKKKSDFEEIEGIDAKIQWAKEANEKLKSFIQEQRKKIRGSSSSTSQPKKPNPQDQEKIQSQEKEIELLKKQLTELQNQIEELKKNQNNNSPDQPANPEISQQIESLQNKKQEIQDKLKQKQSQQKELKDKVNQQQPENKFNWLYVVIPGAVLLVIMGIVIAYLVGKKSKKE